jgi:hypothetical protein
MHSLPFISHHLFVAAVASEDRAHARPARHDQPSVELVDPATDIPLELLEDRQPLPAGAAHPLRISASQARG